MLAIKFIICLVVVIVVFLAPVWLARQNDKAKVDMVAVRSASWLFGWTGIGWLVALYLAVRK